MLWEYEEDPPLFCPYGVSDIKGELFSRGDLDRLQEVLTANKSQFLSKEQDYPYLWSSILLLSQLYEECVLHLKTTGHLDRAVHLALVLNYYGLLRVQPHAHLTWVDLGNLVLELVTKIAKVDCDLAFHYLYVIQQTPNIEISFNFHDIVIKNLCAQSCDLTRVVGSVTPEKVTLDGSMKKFNAPKIIFELCLEAGKLAERNGFYLHALSDDDMGGKICKRNESTAKDLEDFSEKVLLYFIIFLKKVL